MLLCQGDLFTCKCQPAAQMTALSEFELVDDHYYIIEVAPETTGDPEPPPRTNGEAFDPPTYLDLCQKVSDQAATIDALRAVNQMLGDEVERLQKQVNDSDANAIRYRNELVDYRTRVRAAVQ